MIQPSQRQNTSPRHHLVTDISCKPHHTRNTRNYLLPQEYQTKHVHKPGAQADHELGALSDSAPPRIVEFQICDCEDDGDDDKYGYDHDSYYCCHCYVTAANATATTTCTAIATAVLHPNFRIAKSTGASRAELLRIPSLGMEPKLPHYRAVRLWIMIPKPSIPTSNVRNLSRQPWALHHQTASLDTPATMPVYSATDVNANPLFRLG